MAIGWYIGVPYKRREVLELLPYDARFLAARRRRIRYCAMDDYTAEIQGYGGWWTETEVLGDRAIVKVRARQAVLDALDIVFKRLPKDRPDDSLADLSAGVKQALKNELLDMGYTAAEILEHLSGDLGDYTLRDVLRFAARRRLKPRYDAGTDEIILDGPIQECRTIESVDEEVANTIEEARVRGQTLSQHREKLHESPGMSVARATRTEEQIDWIGRIGRSIAGSYDGSPEEKLSCFLLSYPLPLWFDDHVKDELLLIIRSHINSRRR